MLLYLTHHSFPSNLSEWCRSESQDLLLKISDKYAFSLNDIFKQFPSVIHLHFISFHVYY